MLYMGDNLQGVIELDVSCNRLEYCRSEEYELYE